MAKTSSDARHLSPFAATLRELRQAAGLSQARLASLAGVSSGYVGLLETGDRGNRPSAETVKRFATALSLDVASTERLMRSAGVLGAADTLWRSSDEWTVEKAIEADPVLDDEQKVLLLGVYRNFARTGRVVKGRAGTGKSAF